MLTLPEYPVLHEKSNFLLMHSVGSKSTGLRLTLICGAAVEIE
jgi:hypothetical protein